MIIEPKFPKCEVWYYQKLDFDGIKRIVKIIATLQMQTSKRGIVEDVKMQVVDDIYNEYPITDEMIYNEIGKRKNVKSCNYVKVL